VVKVIVGKKSFLIVLLVATIVPTALILPITSNIFRMFEF